MPTLKRYTLLWVQEEHKQRLVLEQTIKTRDCNSHPAFAIYTTIPFSPLPNFIHKIHNKITVKLKKITQQKDI